MDYAERVVTFLSESDDRREVMMAPHAPPVHKSGGAARVAIDAVLDDRDVEDTLLGLRAYGRDRRQGTPVELPDLGARGSFCMGVSGAGRFRVAYMTQRGSKVLCVSRIPPVSEAVVEPFMPQPLENLLTLIAQPQGGVVGILGPDAARNSALAYALIHRINASSRKIIYVIEHSLHYLIRHDDSIIVQSEAGSDVESMEDGLQDALRLQPDLIFAGDVLATDNVPSLARAAECGAWTIVSVVGTSRNAFLCTLEQALGGLVNVLIPRISRIVRVGTAAEGRTTCEYLDAPTM